MIPNIQKILIFVNSTVISNFKKVDRNNLVIKHGDKLKFIDFEDFPDLKLVNFPEEIDLAEDYRQIIFNREKKCAYFLVKSGIISKCYDKILAGRNISEKWVVKDENIDGFDINPAYNYLLYHNHSFVTLLDLEKGYLKTFEDDIFTIIKAFFNPETL